MTYRIGRSDRRALIIGTLVSGSALTFVLCVRPYVRSLHDNRRRLVSESTLLAEESALLRESIAYPNIMKENEDELLQEAPRLVDGSDSLSEYSHFREYIAANAAAAHVFLQSNELRSAVSDADGITTVGIDVHANGDLRGILAFLHSLETGRKLVHVNTLRIQATSDGVPLASNQQDAEVLDVTATINGFALSFSDHRK